AQRDVADAARRPPKIGTEHRRPFAGMTPGSSRGSRRYLRTSSGSGPLYSGTRASPSRPGPRRVFAATVPSDPMAPAATAGVQDLSGTPDTGRVWMLVAVFR